jgi:hypothetical protein
MFLQCFLFQTRQLGTAERQQLKTTGTGLANTAPDFIPHIAEKLLGVVPYFACGGRK